MLNSSKNVVDDELVMTASHNFFKNMSREQIKDWADTCMEFVYNDLGYKYIMKNNRLIVKIKGQTKRRFKRKMKTLYKLEEQGKITKKDVMHVEASYKGHLHYGNTKKLIENTIKKDKIENLEFTEVCIKDNKIIYI